MVIAEGVARMLNPELNLWKASEPVVKDWLKEQLGPAAKLKKMSTSLKALDQFMDEIPQHLTVLENNMSGLSRIAGKVQDMDESQFERFLERPSDKSIFEKLALWIIAISLGIIAFKQLF
jgi:ubiquinone biosynthesis protein